MKKQSISGFYLIIAALFVGMLFVNFNFFKGSASTNIGITDAKVYNLSAEKPSLIKKVLVVPGQEIKAGDLLVETENNLLEIEIAKLAARIKAMKKEKVEKANLVQSKIDYLQAEGGLKLAEYQAEVQQVKSELDLNQKLTEQFAPTPIITINAAGVSPQELKLGSLEEKSKLHNQAITIKVKELLKDSAAELLVLDNEIDLKERELDLLLTEKKKLNKYATFNGVVESVFVKAGEEIAAYAPIISINPIHPSSVVGYMVGARAREISIGTKVTVMSFERKKLTAEGQIIGFGAVAELPEVLQKATTVKAFGREVFIKISDNNHFATGEKVLIK